MITTYEVRNVLRVYGDHLKKKSGQFEEGSELPHGSVDLVDISMTARRRQMLNQISNQLISRVSSPSYEKGNIEAQQYPAPKLLVTKA